MPEPWVAAANALSMSIDHVLRCSACGPVAVTSNSRELESLIRHHLQEKHPPAVGRPA